MTVPRQVLEDEIRIRLRNDGKIPLLLLETLKTDVQEYKLTIVKDAALKETNVKDSE